MMRKTLTNRARRAAALAFAAAAMGLHGFAHGSEAIYVVVSAQSSVRTLTQKQVLAVYTGRTRTLPNGELALPVDQQHEGSARIDFYQALTGMDIARINSYWARLHFTGQVQPPQSVGDDQAVLQRLRRDPQAIGYLTREPQDPAVRVVLRLP